MFRKKKLANTRARREKEMAVDSIPVIDLLNQSNFVDELYSKVLDSIVNRLQSQVKEVAEKDLLLYLQQLFRVSAEKHQDYLNRARRNGLSQQCVVRAHVQKAEKLAAKDSNGLSDPYCMVSVVPSSQFVNLQSAKLNVVKSTSVKESSLNPEWNESYDLFVPRDQIDDFHVQLQVWDYDGNTSGSSKKLHGMKRYVKEVAQAVTSKDDDADDFMGFISVPLSKIPTEGLDSWFKLRPAHSLQRISGRIRFRLELNPLCQQSSDVFNYPDDVILAGLLTAAVENAYQQYDVKKDENKSSDWNGKLPQAAETIIHGFVEQRLVKLLTRAIVRWEVYIGVHLQAGRSLDALFVDGLLKLLEMSSSCVDEQDSSSGSLGSGRYTHVAVIRDSLFKFVKMEIEKIRNHRELFTPQQNNYVVNLGNLLLGLKKIRGMSLYKYLHKHAPSPPTSPDIRDDVIAMLVEGTEAYYAALYDKLLEDSLEEHTSPDVNDNDPPFGGQTVSVLIRLAEQLYRDLSFGLTIYHGVFSKVLDLDYHSYVFQVVEKNLARDASDAMYKVNKTLSLIDDPNHVESETKSILLFRLYLTMRDLSSLAKCVKRIDLSTITTSLSRTSIESDTGVSSENGQVAEDGCSATVEASDITRYHDWFRPTVIRWLQMSRGRTHDRLRKAVALDKTKAVDEIVKHTSSAVDTIGCLTGVVAFWKSLSWPDPVDAYTIALRMTDDVANAIERYADLVQHKLKEVGFFDDEGQFDVTEELCLTLNNLQYVKSFIEGLPEKMDFRGIAHAVEAHPEGPAGDRVLTTFQALTSVANIGMEKKIKCITAMVGTKMKPDIRKYLRTFAQQAVKCGLGADFHKDQNQNERRKLAETANVAIRPLMNYLHNNITTLNEWLCEPNFKRVLEVLWKVCLQVFRKLTLSEYSQYRPFFFFQSSHALKHHLADFFHADGSGISQQRMNSNEDFRILQSELRMRSAKTQDLMRLFYMQMYEEQQEMASKPLYGFLNIHAWYDLLGEEVNVDIISANELKPLDVNGLSDPFVKVKLGPVMMFLEHREKQTLVEKKTLDPLYDNESFAFQVGKDRVSLDGAMLVFTVLDHDVIGSNDLEGEAVLPLNMLDGVIEDSKANSRNFRLPLTQPGPWCTQARKKKTRGRDANSSSVGEEAKNVAGTSSFSNVSLNEDGLEFQSSFSISPLVLINARSSFDKDAAEFSRGRKRLQSIAETD